MFTRRKLLACLTPVLSLALWVACAGPSATDAGTPETLHLVLLHTNDIHGQVLPRRATWIDREPQPVAGGLPRLAAEVHRVRREETADLLVLDAGDWYQGTPEGMIDVGLSFVSGLVAVGYDAMSLGNHEFDHGLDNVRRLLDEGAPPAICANVFDPATGERVDWVEPYRIVEVAGLRVALIGLLTTETPDITNAEARTLELGAEEVGEPHRGADERGARHLRAEEVGLVESGAREAGDAEQVGVREVGAGQVQRVAVDAVRADLVGAVAEVPGEGDTAEVRAAQGHRLPTEGAGVEGEAAEEEEGASTLIKQACVFTVPAQARGF